MWEEYGEGVQKDYLIGYQPRRRQQVAAVKERHPVPSSSLWPAFEEYFEQVLTMSNYFNERIGMRVGFECRWTRRVPSRLWTSSRRTRHLSNAGRLSVHISI